MPPQYIFTIENLSKAYGKKDVLKDIWLSFYPGAKIGVIGGNGSGKSTLLRIMAGVDKDFLGTARPAPGISHRLSCRRSRTLDPTWTSAATSSRPSRRSAAMLDAVRRDQRPARRRRPTPTRWTRCSRSRRKVQDAIEAAEGWDLDRRVEIAMDAMRLPAGRRRRRHPLRRRAPARRALQDPARTARPAPARRAHQPPRRRERRLARTPPAGVSRHRRRASPTTATSSTTSPSWILELDRGQGIPWQGNYSSWLEQKQARLALEEKQESARRKTLARELEWVRMSPRARVAKNRARLQRYEQLASQDAETRDEAVVLQIPPGPHLGDLVVEAEDVSKGYGDRLLFEDMTFRLPPGGIVGVIGPNGAGKTTLFRMIVGQETPDGGVLRVGDTVVISYVDQNRDALNPENTIFQEITGGARPRSCWASARSPRGPTSPRSTSRGPTRRRRSASLSGGERNRVHLAKLLKSGGNLLLLDEPTNDLDVDMLRALEEALDRLRRLRRGHQPRPLVPRPDRHPHPRLRGGQPGRLVRRQLPDLRGPAPRAPRHRRRPAAPHPVQVVEALSGGLAICRKMSIGSDDDSEVRDA